jgi:integrase
LQDKESQKRIPLDEYTARDLLDWYRITLHRNSDDFAFAASSSRAEKNEESSPCGCQPSCDTTSNRSSKEWASKSGVTWHTFRHTYTTLLRANREEVKVVQELLRHRSSRITLDIYAQAQMPAKRAAEQKVVEMVRSERHSADQKPVICSTIRSMVKSVNSAKSLILLASPTGFELVLSP